MSRPAQYSSDTAFRQALESRLMILSRTEKVDIQRLRRQIAFDRFLCRLFNSPAAPWALKGGYAMELRLTTARTTRDIDLTFRRSIAGNEKARNRRILEMIQDAAALDLGDCFVFLVGESIMDLDGAPYGGERFPVETRMDGRLFTRFHLDIGVGDAVLDPMETVHGRDWLQFAGISDAAFPVIPREQQFAEKYHAYTRPRDKRENSRVRDLADMLLLIHDDRLDHARTLTLFNAPSVTAKPIPFRPTFRHHQPVGSGHSQHSRKRATCGKTAIRRMRRSLPSWHPAGRSRRRRQ